VTPIEEETREVQVEALSVLSAGNLIIVLCLLGVLLLQAGQEYAQRQEARERARVEEATTATETNDKKNQ